MSSCTHNSNNKEALIHQCINGLTTYAAQQAQKDCNSPAIAEMRNLIERLACYWGLEDANPEILQKDFVEPFDARMEAVKSGIDVTETSGQCASTIYGLHAYCVEMLNCQGAEEIDEIRYIRDLIKEIATAWDFESHILDDLISWLEAQIHSFSDNRLLEPHMEMQ